MREEKEQLTQSNAIEALVKDYLKDKRRARRAKWFVRLVFLVLLISVFIFISKKETNHSIKQPHAAVITLEGGIFSKSKANAERFINALELAFKNKDAKVILLAINSPGGSPVQADEMYHSIISLRKEYPKKKVIAVCSEMCASAAYYVASAANTIYANPSSIVGSIGVISSGFGFSELMSKLGIKRRVYTAGKNKSFLDPFSEVRPGDKEKLQTMLTDIHNDFKNNVIAGRGKRLTITDETFSGLFWTGRQAKKMGLIDGFSSIRQPYKTLPRVPYSHDDNLFEQINKQLTESMVHEFLTYLFKGEKQVLMV